MRNVKFKIQIELNKNQGEGGMADTGCLQKKNELSFPF
jgi:hypothetical protein